MTEQAIIEAILRSLYEAKFFPTHESNIKKLREMGGWDHLTFRQVEAFLTGQGLIAPYTNTSPQITLHGIFHAEKHGFAPQELQKTNECIRTFVLDFLANAYDTNGPDRPSDVWDLFRESDADKDLLTANLDMLREANYINFLGGGSVEITHTGLQTVQAWRARTALVESYKSIAEMIPTRRGRELQKFFARILEQHGWLQEEGVKTSNEEIDVIIHQGREYYLVECKWEKNPIEAAVIREFYGKLMKRADVRGIVVSMSGFTSGAKDAVKDHMGSRIILLFGNIDVENMVYNKIAFEELLNEKYGKLVMHSQVVYQ